MAGAAGLRVRPPPNPQPPRRSALLERTHLLPSQTQQRAGRALPPSLKMITPKGAPCRRCAGAGEAQRPPLTWLHRPPAWPSHAGRVAAARRSAHIVSKSLCRCPARRETAPRAEPRWTRGTGQQTPMSVHLAYVRARVSVGKSFTSLYSLPYSHCHLKILCKHENKSCCQKIVR